MLPNLRSQVLGACGQINRRRLDVRVSHHLGERENVAPAFEHERGKRVTQLVRTKSSAKALHDHVQQVFEAARRESGVHGQRGEELRTRLARALPLRQIALQAVCESSAHWDHAVLATLALPDIERRVREVNVGELEIEELALTQSGKHQGGEQCVIATT